MVSSGGGGTPKQPANPTPSGPTTAYGGSTPFDPSAGFDSVLPGGGAFTPEMLDARWASNDAARAAAPPPPPPAQPAGPSPNYLASLMPFLAGGGGGAAAGGGGMRPSPFGGSGGGMNQGMDQRSAQYAAQMLKGQMGRGTGIPAPPPGASPTDMAMYTAANNSAQAQQRARLASLMSAGREASFSHR